MLSVGAVVVGVNREPERLIQPLRWRGIAFLMPVWAMLPVRLLADEGTDDRVFGASEQAERNAHDPVSVILLYGFVPSEKVHHHLLLILSPEVGYGFPQNKCSRVPYGEFVAEDKLSSHLAGIM